MNGAFAQMNAGLTPAELNAEGGKRFKAGDYRGAAMYYELATGRAAADPVSIYFSNLAAAYLKLGRYPLAQDAAAKALQLEPRATKARYRRAIARKLLKWIPEALLDITTLLTCDPDNSEAKAEYQILIDMQKKDGRGPLAPENILECCSPLPYGSLTSPRHGDPSDPHQQRLPFFRMVPPLQKNAGSNVDGACMECTKPMRKKDLKTCQKCKRVNYCSVQCQRAAWPGHKQTCNVASDDNVTIRTGRRLADHPYFQTHLLLYAMRTMRKPRLRHETHDMILMVVVDMVLVEPSKPNGTKRTIVKNLVAVPICLVPQEVIYTLTHAVHKLSTNKPLHALWIVTTGIYPEGEECKFRLNVLPADEIITSSAHLPHFSLDLHSQSYGVFRRVTCDLDFLFWSINDELRLDIDNYYQFQA
ncbi:hypothetical protein DFH07DRAFT_830441 [Mycena maculata]|uniref:MYND-type domain-containing protein n=1 Tax=Mycena maculata TaxID=230809 RepID=A0AAD7IQ83_9AGAR|nr:hypothetical protein DFH07DRAFT_830441 [Mycena maculata]